MAIAKVKSQGKSVFVRDLLRRNPDSRAKDINEEWEKAGNVGIISSALISQIRSAGTKPAGNGPTASKGTPQRPTVEATKKPQTSPWAAKQASSEANGQSAVAGGEGALLDELEGEIDDLIFRLKGLGGMSEVEEALRRARRMLVLDNVR